MIDVKLEKYLNKMRRRLYKWGKKDCVLFACDWVEEYLDFNPAEGAHGQYSTEEGAYKYLKNHYGSIEEGLGKYFDEIPPPFRQKGDIALCRLEGGDTMGICGARGFVFFKADPKGVYAMREPEIIKAWRVER